MRPRRRGKYRHRVALYDTPETTQDTYLQPSTTGVQIVNTGAADGFFWARIEPFRGQELEVVRQMWSTATHKVGLLWIQSYIPTTPNNPYSRLLPRMYIVEQEYQMRIDFLQCDNVELRDRAWECIGTEKVQN